LTNPGQPIGHGVITSEPVDAAEATRQTRTGRARWLDPAWQMDVLAWIERRLAEHGMAIRGPVTQPHIRPWSTALAVPTSAGQVWFKAAGPGTIQEAGLLEAMVRLRTPGILEPLALDPDRGWILLPNGGPRLRDVADDRPGVDHWLRILPEWAQMQRRLAAHVEELLTRGVPDLRPTVLPDLLATLADDPEAVLSADERARVRALVPAYTGWCAELDASGIEPSLQHDDLHDGNVFVGEGVDRIFDWGDASVAHPFGTLLSTLRSIASRGLDDEPANVKARTLDRLRDVYLEAWTDGHSLESLRRIVPVAMRVAIVGRSLSWKRSLVGIPMDDRGDWADRVGGWLTELFEPDLV
jgi:hypothetical protein